MQDSASARDRPDTHNAAVDEELARGGGCAQIHLPTGRTCGLERGHAGSCQFVPRDELPGPDAPATP